MTGAANPINLSNELIYLKKFNKCSSKSITIELYILEILMKSKDFPMVLKKCLKTLSKKAAKCTIVNNDCTSYLFFRI